MLMSVSSENINSIRDYQNQLKATQITSKNT